ncbi:MAG: efflux transporter outer membrane subunit [Caulobacteraceae bacterium]|nr:efflux transporter outer membrane subunit [Caulobacteraceae bacterium]
MALAAAACAALPSPGPRATPKPASSYETEKSLAGPSAAWPSDHWWIGYGDPQLTGLITEALAGAPDLAIAEARLRKADAFRAASRAKLLPTVEFDGGAGHTRLAEGLGVPALAGGHNVGYAGLGLGWELDFWGKNRASLRAATSEDRAAAEEREEARLVLSTAIASDYADLAALYADRDTVVAAASIHRQTAELMAGRQEKGLENAAATERARSAAEGSEAEVAALDESIDNTRHAIAALMGDGPDRGLAIHRPTAEALNTPGVPANLPADLLGRRPDIVAARLRAEAAAQRIKAAKASFYPNINLQGVIGGGTLDLGHAARMGSIVGAIGPALSLPIFDGGRLRANYRGAEADYNLAVAEYDRTVSHAFNEVADAATSRKELEVRLAHSRASLADAKAAYTVTDNRYRGGLATYLEVLTAEDSMISAQRQVASLESRAFTLDVAMVRALGGGFQS